MGIGSNDKIFATAVINLGAAMPAHQLSQAVRKISLDALEGLVNMTPRDTGRAKGNWNVTTTSPSTKKASDEKMDVTGGNSIAAGTAKILSATASNKVPKSIYITNNVDYIEDLENGRKGPGQGSLQAPDGMLKVTVNRLTLEHNVGEA